TKDKNNENKSIVQQKIDRNLSSIQAKGISRYRQMATIQNFLKINIARENSIDPVLPIDQDYIITIANKVNIEKDKQTCNKDIFTKKFQEIKQNLLKQEGNVLKRDKCIATWLRLHNPELVTIIRKANEVYSNIAYKQLAKKPLSQEELNFIKFRDEIESSAVKVTHITGDNQEKIIQKKKLLIDNK
ncbi:43098_t:CDS:2, partial [Gigaspora margarita]